jgi:hypothetical protein
VVALSAAAPDGTHSGSVQLVNASTGNITLVSWFEGAPTVTNVTWDAFDLGFSLSAPGEDCDIAGPGSSEASVFSLNEPLTLTLQMKHHRDARSYHMQPAENRHFWLQARSTMPSWSAPCFLSTGGTTWHLPCCP